MPDMILGRLWPLDSESFYMWKATTPEMGQEANHHTAGQNAQQAHRGWDKAVP